MYLKAREVGDARPADQVGDGFASVLDRPHELLQVLQKRTRKKKTGYQNKRRNDRNGYQVRRKRMEKGARVKNARDENIEADIHSPAS